MKKKTKKQLLIAVACLIVIAVMTAFVALIAVPSVKNAAINAAKEGLFENYYSFPESGIITSQNGFRDNEKNSLLYVKSALQNGADCVEVDVCFDENRKPYVAESQEAIDENSMPLEYLVSYLSEEANINIARRHSINLHLTDAANLKEVDEIIKRYDMKEYCVLTGVNLNQASYVRSNCNLSFYIDYKLEKSKIHDTEYISLVMSEVSASGAIGINCDVDTFSTELSNIFKENWLKISFYGVETELDMIEALVFAPNQVITSDPEAVRSLLTEWNAKAPSSDIINS